MTKEWTKYGCYAMMNPQSVLTCFLPWMSKRHVTGLRHMFREFPNAVQLDTHYKQLAFVVAHELWHAQQFQLGKLVFEKNEEGETIYIWDGEPYDISGVENYTQLPWEVEANVAAMLYMREYFNEGNRLLGKNVLN
jgi:hypothetical protein